ncbi:beta-glucosidase [Ranunculus cassubicifolius]
MWGTKFSFSLSMLCFFVVISQEEIQRSQFPEEFFFGVATSSYQVEGAVLEDGRGLNSWDVFTHIQGKIKDGGDADVTDDHYHQYEEDIDLIHSIGVNSYRFSISWTRILPKGRFGGVNPNGIMFYNKLIDKLLQKGIEPFVTLSHHDIPQKLEEKYQSWLNPLIQDDFVYYADICFRNFGDRVKYWITINEPNLFVNSAYLEGRYPPGRCSAPFGNCSSGNSEIEPLIAAHNMILSHAKASQIYRKHYPAEQGGYIMLVPHAAWYIPISDSEADREAASRAVAFQAPWIIDPLVFGDYPPEMRKILGDRLVDFIGFNHYATLYAKDCIHSACKFGGHPIEGFVQITNQKNGIPIGEPTAFPKNFVTPYGFEMLIEYLKKRYNLPMIILENGMAQANEPLDLHNELLYDIKRVNYHKSYLAALHRTMRKGADVRGYFVWSLMDNFEWNSGFIFRFGLYYVDYNTLKRTPKESAKWYNDFLTNGTKLEKQAITGSRHMIRTQ